MSDNLVLSQELQLGPQIQTKAEVIPIDPHEALKSYTEDEQKEVVSLSERIDPREFDKIMSYGSSPLISTFEGAGKILKEEEGTDADQRVIKEVIELSQAANKSYDDFNLALREPTFFEKILLKLSKSKKKQRAQKIKEAAITNYRLLLQLRDSCDSWLDMLKDSMFQITSAGVEDRLTSTLLEKYIVAGKLANERIEKLLEEKKAEYEASGTQQDADEYDELKEGYDLFQIVLGNLEKSRVMYKLSIGQLSLTQRSNRNLQIAIHTQKSNSMALVAQQLRNAILDAKNKEVLEGQQAITRFNDELMKKVSSNVALTAKESEELIYAGFYNLDAAKEAITKVISSCQEIEKIKQDMVPAFRQNLSEVNKLVEEMEPYVSKIKSKSLIKSQEKDVNAIGGTSELSF